MRHYDTYMLQIGQSGGTRTHIHILKVCALNAHVRLWTTDTKSAGPVVTEAPTLERPSYMQPSRRIRRQLSYRLEIGATGRSRTCDGEISLQLKRLFTSATHSQLQIGAVRRLRSVAPTLAMSDSTIKLLLQN